MFKPASLMIGARVVNMAMGIISIPVLLWSLGVDTFAAWAVLLGGGAAFATLELGMPVTIIRYLSVAAEQNDRKRIDTILTNAAAIILIAYGLGFFLLFPFSTRIGFWLNLPNTDICSPSQLILITFSMVAVRALLNLGVSTLYAMRHFRMTALFSFLQAFLSNTGAWVAALSTGKLEMVLFAYWGAQIVVLFVANRFAGRRVRWRIRPNLIGRRVSKEILLYGLRVQLNEWSLFFNFQFNKFIIAAHVGLSAVAPYELAIRGGMALRSIPSSGLDTVLPDASIRGARGEALWQTYLETIRVGIHAVILFLLIPMMLSPLFLYAWAGEVGTGAALAFFLFMPGVIANILALPAGLLLQAMGKERLLVKTALATIGLNILLSIVCVSLRGMEGAAMASAVAMLVGAIWLTAIFHHCHQRRLRDTAFHYGRKLWPVPLICAFWAGFAFLLEPLFQTHRLAAVGITVALYLGCGLSLISAQWRAGWFNPSEIAFLRGLFRRKKPRPRGVPLSENG